MIFSVDHKALLITYLWTEEIRKQVAEIAIQSYLARCHVANRPMSLNGLQLIQAPVQFFQSLDRQLRIGFIYVKT